MRHARACVCLHGPMHACLRRWVGRCVGGGVGVREHTVTDTRSTLFTGMRTTKCSWTHMRRSHQQITPPSRSKSAELKVEAFPRTWETPGLELAPDGRVTRCQWAEGTPRIKQKWSVWHDMLCSREAQQSWSRHCANMRFHAEAAARTSQRCLLSCKT